MRLSPHGANLTTDHTVAFWEMWDPIFRSSDFNLNMRILLHLLQLFHDVI